MVKGEEKMNKAFATIYYFLRIVRHGEMSSLYTCISFRGLSNQ